MWKKHLTSSVILVPSTASYIVDTLKIFVKIIHSLNNYLLSISFVPGIILSVGNTALNKIDIMLALMELTFQ